MNDIAGAKLPPHRIAKRIRAIAPPLFSTIYMLTKNRK